MNALRSTFQTTFVAAVALVVTSAAGAAPWQHRVDAAPARDPVETPRNDASEAPRLPPNMEFTESLRPILHRMWAYSPTFRRQCARLAEARNLTVIILVGRLPEHEKSRASALTRISGRPGRPMQAEVLLGLADLELHIAHELEHIIERIDGVHVELMAALAIQGVDRLGNSFETARAKETGRAVEREVVARNPSRPVDSETAGPNLKDP
jgi:hypothetical protein